MVRPSQELGNNRENFQINKEFQTISAMTSIFFGTGITSIAPYAFSQNSSLVNLTIPTRITTIGQVSFNNEYCFFLNSAQYLLPSYLLRKNAFSNNSHLVHISLPTSLHELSSFTFGYCSSLKSIIIPT